MRSRLRLALSSLSVLFTLFAVDPAVAQWPFSGLSTGVQFPMSDGSGNVILGGGISISKWTPAGTTQWISGLSGTPGAAAPDGSGGGIYAELVGSGSADIQAQRLNASGGSQWGTPAICNLPSAQNQPRVATDAAGNSYFVWHDERGGVGTNQFFAQKLNSAGVPQWATNGVLVEATGISYTEATAMLVPDEAGGCYFIWEDSRPGTLGSSDLYAQRLNSSGAPAWAAGGVPVCIAAGQQFFVQAIADGSGGMIALWMDMRSGTDFDLYAQRVDSNGASLWAANGVPIVSAPGDQSAPVLRGDGAGGAFAIWADGRNSGVTGADIYAQHFDGTGASLWTPNGLVVINTPVQETNPNLALDGAGGVFVAWLSAGTMARAQHLDATGTSIWEAAGVEFTSFLAPTVLVPDGTGGALIGGLTAPGAGVLSRVLAVGEQAWVPNYRAVISSVDDVPSDEGGWVTVHFSKPLSDGAVLTPPTNGYSLWRKEPAAAPAGVRLVDERHVVPDFARMAQPARYTDFPPGQWNSVSYTPAIQAATYSMLAPTHTDFTGQGNVNDSYVVVAHTATPTLFVVSAVASGHSVDNLAPGPPQNLAGGYEGGTTVDLHWSANVESDLWHYSVYKGTSSSFVPSDQNRVGQPTSAAFQDVAFDPGVSYYKVSAVDRHGNESGFALLGPSQITGVTSGDLPDRTYLARPSPNPFHSEMAIEYGLAWEAKVSLTVYDLRGGRVASLVDEVQAAGVRHVVWNGLDDSHHATSGGVYLLRFVAGDVHRSVKLIRAR